MIEKLLILIMLSGVGSSLFIPTPSQMKEEYEKGQSLFVVEDYKGAIRQYQKVLNIKSRFLHEDRVTILFNNEFEMGLPMAATYQMANAFKKMSMWDEAI
ncbi:MAG: hypothetical protein ACE5QV_09360, partial [Fidelibacterota bacterium]